MKSHNIKSVYTIGHSTHPLEVLVAMLHSIPIELVVDIRSYPGSRKYPQFNKENLAVSLPKNNIEYIHLGELGGRRKVKPDSKNTSWRHLAFRGYADYMETPEFKSGLLKLEKLASNKTVAFMCSEAVWWRCHRSMVADILKLHGWTVMHIMGMGKTSEHPYTQPASIVEGELSYEGKYE
ncbi:MAG TPA: DUF488 domain-containing protein [Fulvivirga sp.]|nr:DUF488 domain-containing protein [Fulvivirga sp.]